MTKIVHDYGDGNDCNDSSIVDYGSTIMAPGGISSPKEVSDIPSDIPQISKVLNILNIFSSVHFIRSEQELRNCEWICVKCSSVLYRPVEIGCGHLFCRSCVLGEDKSTDKSTFVQSPLLQCPLDHTPILPTLAPLQTVSNVVRQISRLEVRCPYEVQHGCTWQGKFGIEGNELYQHIQLCGKIQCEHCHLQILDSEKIHHIDVDCLDVFIECSACQWKLKRRTLSEHKKSCSNALVACKYVPFGCATTLFKRSDIHVSHYEGNQTAHEQMLIGFVLNLKMMVSAQQSKLNQQEQMIKRLQNKKFTPDEWEDWDTDNDNNEQKELNSSMNSSANSSVDSSVLKGWVKAVAKSSSCSGVGSETVFVERSATSPSAIKKKIFTVPQYLLSFGKSGTDKTFKKIVRSTTDTLCEPVSVHVTDTRIFVSNYSLNCVKVFTLEGEYCTSLKVENPHGITSVQTKDGFRIFVSESDNNRIAVFDGKYNFLNHIATGKNGSPRLLHPKGITATSDRLFISNSGTHQITCVDFDGYLVTNRGHKGSDINEFLNPNDVWRDPDTKNLYVVDFKNDRISVVHEGGTFVNIFGRDKGNELNNPRGICGYKGRIYVSDSFNNRIAVYDYAGNFIGEFGKKGENRPGEFVHPNSIFIKNDIIYVCDHWNEKIQTFKLLL